jgi:hypothetical protein
MMTAVIALLLGSLLAVALTRNYVQATTRGTEPLERLARRGRVTRAMADSLKTQPYPGSWKWYAARTASANGDTIRFRIFRAQDVRFPAMLLLSDPHVSGGGRYIVSERRFVALGIGVR